MINEDFCSYEVSKLLEEKGFDEEIETLITPSSMLYHLDENSVKREKHTTTCNSKINMYMDDVSCPTHQMAMKWLREVHKLFITIDWTGYESEFGWTVQDMNDNIFRRFDETHNTYEDVVEAALKFCLTEIL